MMRLQDDQDIKKQCELATTDTGAKRMGVTFTPTAGGLDATWSYQKEQKHRIKLLRENAKLNVDCNLQDEKHKFIDFCPFHPCLRLHLWWSILMHKCTGWHLKIRLGIHRLLRHESPISFWDANLIVIYN